MSTDSTAVAAPPPRERVSPFFVIGCGVTLLLAAFALQWIENANNAETRATAQAAVQAREAVLRDQQAGKRLSYADREALARAEQERVAAEEAAEKARKASLLADAESEARARAEREEMSRKRTAVEEAHRAAEQNEDAWKRFYRPSANCRDPGNSATVECVNEYVKAKREFEVKRATEGAR